ncbi:hypothetical protein RHCRD62_30221 [Rhodococcus sp. RD6.2]|uniref:hypothetical protein n=1 Tax=Rhodococcus sp. RD6.2 TaxID=260936 RepID=UPI00063B6ABD|nr:hypothetical protein [Rhodococcus sp. RD6.2]CRK51557.1 hypothetical protein RHCRD62_30221 [Rhodococcus sp. RD6.2]
MTRPDDIHSDPTIAYEEAGTKRRRKWTWPKHVGRLRTSTVVLIVAFLGAALLRSYLMAAEAEEKARQLQTVVQVPVETTPQQMPTATTVPTTTPPTSTTTPETTATSETPTASPLIVLPPGLVPSGVELPPGVAVETTTTPAAPTATPPTTSATP